MKAPITLSHWHRTDRRKRHYDFAIVGGGLTGCAIAYWLRRFNPGARIAVVEQGSIAWGASGRNAGFLLQGGAREFGDDLAVLGARRLRYIWELTAENIDLVEAEIDPDAVQFRRAGSFVCAADFDEARELDASIETLLSWSVSVESCHSQRLREELGAEGFSSGVHFPRNGVVHPARLVRYLAEASGADLLENHRVLSIDSASGGPVIDTTVAEIHAPQAVLAANAYTPLLLDEALELIDPKRAQMFATVPQRMRLRAPVYSHCGFYYVRQLEDGRVLAGGARHLHLEDEIGYDDGCTEAVQNDIARYVRAHFPWADVTRIESRWSGTMGFSPDGIPIVGDSSQVPGLVWVGGFCGHGMAYGLAFGKRVASYLLGISSECMEHFSAVRLKRAIDSPAKSSANGL